MHDKNSKQGAKQNIASVSVAVNAGSFNDPPHRPGLAHFLEHMIFMGSEKYPGEKVFNDHIAQNGGYTNAYTENSLTNYQFSVGYDSLQKALDMKAHLLAFPLLSKDAQEREIQAVNNEFEGNYPYDSVRTELILNQSITDRTHPCANFGWGNMVSLAGQN